MGITIHIQGNLKDKSEINSFIEELTDISKTMHWEWQVLDEDWSQPSTAKLKRTNNITEITGNLALKGISINLHPKCESLSLFFDSSGCLTTPMAVVLLNEGRIKKENVYSTVKTQFTPPDVHISIIKLLKYLKKRYIPDLKVEDEGGYWESEDKQVLTGKIKFLNEKLDMLQDMLSNMDDENAGQRSAEQLADIIEEKLKGL